MRGGHREKKDRGFKGWHKGLIVSLKGGKLHFHDAAIEALVLLYYIFLYVL